MSVKVLNFGSLNYDYVYQVDHMTMAGETQTSYGMETHLGGKGFNQSVALAKAGTDIYHAGSLGEDGQMFIDACREYGIKTDFLRMIDGKSGHTIIQVDKTAQNCILLFGGANREQDKDFIDEVISHFDEGDYLVLQNEVNHLDYIIDKAYEKGLNIVLNPSPYDSYLDSCDFSKVKCFLLNEIEGKMLTGKEDPNEILEIIKEKFPNAATVLTLGSDGAYYQDKDEKVFEPAMKVKAVDTTAAGDTFTGFFISGLLRNEDVKTALKNATKAASIAVTREGAAGSIPYLKEVIGE